MKAKYKKMVVAISAIIAFTGSIIGVNRALLNTTKRMEEQKTPQSKIEFRQGEEEKSPDLSEEAMKRMEERRKKVKRWEGKKEDIMVSETGEMMTEEEYRLKQELEKNQDVLEREKKMKGEKNIEISEKERKVFELTQKFLSKASIKVQNIKKEILSLEYKNFEEKVKIVKNSRKELNKIIKNTKRLRGSIENILKKDENETIRKELLKMVDQSMKTLQEQELALDKIRIKIVVENVIEEYNKINQEMSYKERIKKINRVKKRLEKVKRIVEDNYNGSLSDKIEKTIRVMKHKKIELIKEKKEAQQENLSKRVGK